MGSTFSFDNSAAAERLTCYIQQHCFASPADFLTNGWNTLLAKAVFVPDYIWISCLVLGYFLVDVYITLCGLLFGLDFWILSPVVKGWIDDPPPFPGCGGVNGNPSTTAEQLTLFFVVLYSFPFFYNVRRFHGSVVIATTLVWTYVTYVLIHINMADARQIQIGMLLGVLYGLVFQLFVFYFIFPARDRESWGRYHGHVKWVGWPILMVFHYIGKDMKLTRNGYWSEHALTSSVEDGGPTVDAKAPGESTLFERVSRTLVPINK